MNVVVLGGGISGLSCAYYLSTLGKNIIRKVILIEHSTTLGGWIRTTRFPDGTIYEHGPRSLRPNGVEGLNSLKLVEDLGLADSVLPVTGQSLSARQRFILVNKKLYALPNKLLDVLQKRPPFSKPLIFSALKDLFARKKSIDDESLYSFTCRRFGQEVADYIMDPFCRGVVAGDAKEISTRSLFKHMYAAEQRYGSVIWGQIKDKGFALQKLFNIPSELGSRSLDEHWSMWTFQNGLQCLPEALTTYLENHEFVSLYTNSTCSRIKFENNKAVVITEEAELEADHVFACIPSKRLSQLISMQYPKMAALLMSIPAVHVGLVNLEYPGRVLKEEGFGYLVPSNQRSSKLLGVVFDSCCFPFHDGKYQDKTRITCMMGGHWFRELFGDVDSVMPEKLLEIAVQSISEDLGIKEPISKHSAHIHRNCIPQYKVGHHFVLDSLLQNITDHKMCLSLLGASYHGVGINDCIFSAKTTVQKYISNLDRL